MAEQCRLVWSCPPSHYRGTKEPKPLSHEQMVRAVLKQRGPDGSGGYETRWWTVRKLRKHIETVYHVDIEAVTSAIRRLRQEPLNLKIECKKVPGQKHYRYRLASKEPA